MNKQDKKGDRFRGVYLRRGLCIVTIKIIVGRKHIGNPIGWSERCRETSKLKNLK